MEGLGELIKCQRPENAECSDDFKIQANIDKRQLSLYSL